MNRERIEAVMRMLVDSGDMTPMAVRQIRNVIALDSLDAEEQDDEIARVDDAIDTLGLNGL